jgi:hypothetical protein
MGILKLGIPVGGVVIPFLLSVLTNALSLSVALYIFPLAAVVGLLAFVGLKPAQA